MADQHGVTDFLGYDTLNAEGQIVALIVDGKAGDTAQGAVQIALNQSPFYAESGGQVGDAGVIKTDSGTVEITDTKKVAGVLEQVGLQGFDDRYERELSGGQKQRVALA